MSFLAQPPGKTSSHRSPANLPLRPGTGNQEIGLLHQGQARLPRRKQRLKRAMFPSAFASLRSAPVSQAYYQRKRQQGKPHHQAVLALALHTMIRNGALYDPQPATKLPAAADTPHRCPRKDPTTAARHTADRHSHLP